MYFLRVKKQYQTTNVMRVFSQVKWRWNENQTKSTIVKIVNVYISLYTSKTDLRFFIYIDVMKKTHTENRNMFPSYEECKDTVFQMNIKGKYPGVNVILVLLFRYWAIILFSVIGNICSEEIKYPTNLLARYRYISLTHTDYKFIAFCFCQKNYMFYQVYVKKKIKRLI